MNGVLRTEKNGGILLLTLNRPAVYNALSERLLVSLTQALKDGDSDPGVGTVILTGAGKAFSAGGDLGEMVELAEGPEENRRAYLALFKEMIEAIRDISIPVIAAVNGYCIGGGNEINMACDVTIASERAIFGQAGPKVGSVPLLGGIQLLPRIVGEKVSKEMIYLCRTYGANEAKSMGLVNRVVPHEELMVEAESWAREILEKSPTAIAMAKRAHNEASGTLGKSMAEGAEFLTRFWGTEEAREGLRAFQEKRKPDFRKFIEKK